MLDQVSLLQARKLLAKVAQASMVQVKVAQVKQLQAKVAQDSMLVHLEEEEAQG
jgi:hypothetical protein